MLESRGYQVLHEVPLVAACPQCATPAPHTQRAQSLTVPMPWRPVKQRGATDSQKRPLSDPGNRCSADSGLSPSALNTSLTRLLCPFFGSMRLGPQDRPWISVKRGRPRIIEHSARFSKWTTTVILCGSSSVPMKTPQIQTAG